jgi:uncharacterized protein (UPF0332 family)
MSVTKKELVKYRYERAIETFSEAQFLAEKQSWNGTSNRLYYASFYAVIALIALYDEKAFTHSGIKILFHKNYIKTGAIPMKFGIMYSKLFDLRQSGDYDDFQKLNSETVQPLIPEVESFLAENSVDLLFI